MGKEKTMWHPGNCKFRYRYVQLFANKLYGLVHIINAEVFAYQTEIMFGSSGNNDFTFPFISKSNRIPNQVSPSTGGRTNQNRIITAFFHQVNFQCLRTIYHIPFAIEVFIVEGYKFEEQVLAGYQAHASFILTVLVGNKPFRSKIGFNISNGFAQKLFKSQFI